MFFSLVRNFLSHSTWLIIISPPPVVRLFPYTEHTSYSVVSSCLIGGESVFIIGLNAGLLGWNLLGEYFHAY